MSKKIVKWSVVGCCGAFRENMMYAINGHKRYLFIAFILSLMFLLLISAYSVASSSPPKTWSSNIKLSYEAVNPHYGSDIVVNGDFVYVVWADGRYRNYEIFFKRSIDGGRTWSDDIRLTNNSHLSTAECNYGDDYSCIAISDNCLHVVWNRDVGGPSSPTYGGFHHYEIFYKRSTDMGETWEEEKQLTVSGGYGAKDTNIIAEERNVHLVYIGENYKTYYIRSRDEGETWDNPIIISMQRASWPSISCYENNIHVAYTGDPENVYHVRSLNNGQSWEEPKSLASTPFECEIAVDHENVYIAFSTGRGIETIWFLNSTDNGETWESNRIDNGIGKSTDPDIATSLDKIHLVWYDYRDNNQEIYYKLGEIKNNIIYWEDDQRLTYDKDDSFYPTIAVDEEYAYVIWSAYNFTEDYTYVYFKRTAPYQGYLTGNISKPVVKVFSPHCGDTVDPGVIWIKGIAYATDPNLTIQKVEVRIGVTGEWEIANGTTNWSYKWHVPDTGEYERYRIFVRAYDGGSYSEYCIMYVDVRPWNWWLMPYGAILIAVLFTGVLLVLKWYLKNKTFSKISTISLVIMWVIILFVIWYIWQFSK